MFISASNPQPPNDPILLISTNFGTRWENAQGLKEINEINLFFDYDQGQVVYAVGIYDPPHRSNDGGKTWTACGRTGVRQPKSDSRAAVDPRNSDKIIVATRGSGVFRSEDGCKTWRGGNPGLGNLFVNTVAIDPKNPDRVFAGTDGGAYVSFDGGKSWNAINDGLLGSLVVYSIVVDPRDSSVYASTPYGIFKLEAR